MSTTANELLFSERVTAEKLGVSERTMFNLRQDGQIPFVRVRTRIMYSPTALEKWIESRGEAARH